MGGRFPEHQLDNLLRPLFGPATDVVMATPHSCQFERCCRLESDVSFGWCWHESDEHTIIPEGKLFSFSSDIYLQNNACQHFEKSFRLTQVGQHCLSPRRQNMRIYNYISYDEALGNLPNWFSLVSHIWLICCKDVFWVPPISTHPHG